MEEKSKSELKREMTALQKLAIDISKLTEGLIAQIPLPSELKKAVLEYKYMTAHGAMRRQAQYLGKLMRGVDAEPIKDAYNNIQQQHQQQSQNFHQIEIWRERLMNEGKPALTEFINTYPETSVQELRQLISKAIIERTQEKKTGAQKALFRYLTQQISL